MEKIQLYIAVFLIVCAKLCYMQNITTTTTTTMAPTTAQNISSNPNQVVNVNFSLPGGRLLGALKWIKLLALKGGGGGGEGFFGRCLGAARRLKFVMPFILFKLGVIVTTLAFLTMFAVKGITVGIVLLLLNAAGLLGKAALLKAGLAYKDSQSSGHQVPITAPAQTAVHLHVHKDGDGGYNLQHPTSHASKYYDYMPTAWSDRISKGLSETQSISEKLELMQLYNRLGLNVNNVIKHDANSGSIIYPLAHERD